VIRPAKVTGHGWVSWSRSCSLVGRADAAQRYAQAAVIRPAKVTGHGWV
jgi:hypothetical protein